MMMDEHKVKINIFMAEQYIQTIQAGSGGLESWFKLNSSINLTNMIAFDRDNKLKKYNSIHQIIQEHFEIRIEFNEKRKRWKIKKMNMELDMDEEKMRFIRLQLEDKLILHKRKMNKIIEDLFKFKFKTQKYFDEIKHEL